MLKRAGIKTRWLLAISLRVLLVPVGLWAGVASCGRLRQTESLSSRSDGKEGEVGFPSFVSCPSRLSSVSPILSSVFCQSVVAWRLAKRSLLQLYNLIKRNESYLVRHNKEAY